MLMYFFLAGFFFLNLTLCMTELRVLVLLCLSYYVHFSNPPLGDGEWEVGGGGPGLNGHYSYQLNVRIYWPD